MKKYLLILALLFPCISFSQNLESQYEEEWLIDYYKASILMNDLDIAQPSVILNKNQQAHLLFQSLYELLNDEDYDINLKVFLDSNKKVFTSNIDRLRYYIFKFELYYILNTDDLHNVKAIVQKISNSQKCLYKLELKNILNLEMCEEKNNSSSGHLSPEHIRSIFNYDIDYLNKPFSKLYMFCRKERQYPCIMLMKDSLGKIVRNQSKTIWSQKALGYSRKKKASYEFDGNTPAGIFLMKGVMPKANKKMTYGSYRRIILDFVKWSNGEKEQKKLLPPISHNHSWWSEAKVARDKGRSAFRIHGNGFNITGKSKPYYPFMATRGCVAQIEGRFSGKEFFDQRLLLDTLMQAQNLNPEYNNESKIKGVLYVIDIDHQKRPVDYAEIQTLLKL
jgi:hypothetical protein